MRKKFSTGLAWLWVSALVIVLDRLTKLWVSQHLMLGEPVSLLPVLNLTLIYNTGASFGFLHSASGWQNVFLGGLAIVVSFVVLGWLSKLPSRAWWPNIALTLILGGALGNAWDRALYAHVIDFIDFHVGEWHFAIFNVADSAICVGAFMIMFYWMIYSPKGK